MSKKKLIIVGTSLYSDIINYYFSNFTDYEIIGYCESKEYKKEDIKNERKIYVLEDLEKFFNPNEIFLFNSIGYKNHNKIRELRYKQLKKKNFKFASYLSEDATILSNKIGENCLILENNVIQPYSEIGNNSFLWSGNHIGHHTIIKENVFISSHCVVSGNCEIGNNTFIGVNSTINNNIKIGNYSVIGANTLVDKNLQDNSVTKKKGDEVKIIKRDIL